MVNSKRASERVLFRLRKRDTKQAPGLHECLPVAVAGARSGTLEHALMRRVLAQNVHSHRNEERESIIVVNWQRAPPQRRPQSLPLRARSAGQLCRLSLSPSLAHRANHTATTLHLQSRRRRRRRNVFERV